MGPILNIISTPIGNYKDVTFHAIEELKDSDFIIGEEFKETSKFLKHYGITKEFELLNEHSTMENVMELIQAIKRSKKVSLISDSGTPLVEDPGSNLVEFAIQENIEIKMIPGASALLCALVLSGFRISPFTFIGFFSQKEEIRKNEIKKYLMLNHTLVIYETPYRYKKVIQEIQKFSKQNYKIFLGLNLTTPQEIQYRGTIREIIKVLDSFPKALPVIVLEKL
ncbi:MAG: 16S rRNA (cytidine(1402)-2'-O)-methyltransferase [Leptospiraceae bacterium]|nr:16S rRNA (cytidine(1402)-2'-O)-methyltransferase [Leptospiraceae bacterium]MCP5495655.1 16S rRNA (cytidine(1402)-2'-O)-methyltransferase [Leptospiraceae bacterium]